MGSRCQFEQAGAFERGQIIFFHVSKLFAGNGITGYEHQVNGLGQFMLMLPEAFPQEPARPVPGHGMANLLAGNDSEPGGCPVRQFIPICNQAAEGQPLAVLPQTRKVTAPLEARGAPQTQTERWRGVHESKKSNGREPFAAHPTAVGQNGLAALAGITVQKSVLAFAADFRRLILALHKIIINIPAQKPERDRIPNRGLMSSKPFGFFGYLRMAGCQHLNGRIFAAVA